MLNKIFTIAIILVLVLSAAGCARTAGRQERIGAILGAAGGGLLGAQLCSGECQLATTALGALVGGLIGRSIGQAMDRIDRMKAHKAMMKATRAPIGMTINWNNERSGNYGSVTAIRDGISSTGKYCREFYQTITIGGQTERAYGIACRQPDGTWRLVQ